MADRLDDKDSHSKSVAVYGLLAAVCLAFGILGAILANFELTLLTTIPAMILGHYAFKRLENAVKPKEPLKIRNQQEPFVLALKDRSPVTITIEIHYEISEDLSHVYERVGNVIQGRLGEYFQMRTSIPARKTFATIDAVLRPEIEPLKKELRMDKLTLKTILALPGDMGGVWVRERGW